MGLLPKSGRLAINAAMHENCRAELHERWSHELGWDWLKGSNGRKRWTQVRKNAELEYYHLPAEFEWQAKTKSLHALAGNSRSIKPDEKKTKICTHPRYAVVREATARWERVVGTWVGGLSR